jgi:drug/metabolite transporter (DMT)-like permease
MDGSIARPRPFLALGLRLLTAFTLATMAMLLKLGGERGVHLFEMIFWRQAITLVAITMAMAALGKLAAIKSKRMGAHGKRALYGLTGMCFVYGAVILLPLAEATTISFTAPFFAVMLAVILFKEKVGIYRWSAVIMGFAGVLIIMQPWSASGLSLDPIGIGVGLIAAFMVALISFQIQDLNTTESPWSIVFWFMALSTPVAALAMPFVARSHDGETWAILIAMALAGALAQLLLTASLRFGSAAVILLIDYTALLWATLYGWQVFGQLPSSTVWIGAPLIIGAGLLIAFREHVLATKLKSSDRPE